MTEYAPFAIIAALTALWAQIRSFAARLRALVITRTTLHGEVALAVMDHLHRHGKVMNWGDKIIRSSSGWIRPLERVAEIAYEVPPLQPSICWLHGRPLMFQAPAPSRNSMAALPDSSELIIITAIRGTLNMVDLTRAALETTLTRQTTGHRYYVRQVRGKRKQLQNNEPGGIRAQENSVSSAIRPGMTFLHWGAADIGAPTSTNPFSAYALSPESSQARADFTRWLSLKKWYLERKIPWRRGHLYYGPPGTGKTALARALAQDADMPVFAYDLSTLCNEEFSDAWQNMQENTPCMALIEDVDGVFEGRKNVLGDQGGGLTFDCLLNGLGGIQTADGVFIVVTTNKPEVLDEALGKPTKDGNTTRPGRLDRAFLLPLPDDSQREQILRRILGDDGAGNGLGYHKHLTNGMTAAQVTEHAITHALEETWKEPTP